jgi:glycine/D-amino acid oxidase-like deaminating enzyme
MAALDFTTGLIEREEIQCHFSRTGRFRGAWRPQHYDAMGREIDLMRQEIGLDAVMVPRSEQHREVATESYHGGCIFLRHGGLHPALFHQGLLDRALAAGATVVPRTRVTAIAKNRKGFEIAAGAGRLAARDVVVATNGYTALPYFRRRVVPVASYLIATEPLPPKTVERLIPGGRMVVETRSRHCYYRPSPDGRRILLGGRAALHAINTRVSGARLHRLLAGLFPLLAGVKLSHSWTGFVAMSRTQLPHVGVHDGMHYALGYNGSGVAMAPYLGYKVAQLLLGRSEGRTPFEDTPFAPVSFYGGRPWFLPVMGAYYRIKDRLEGSP